MMHHKSIKALTQRAVEDRLGLRPGFLADCFYRGHLDDNFYFVVGGRRQILESAVESIQEQLRRDGRLPQTTTQRD